MNIPPAESRGRVLLADDDQAAREGMAALLRRIGYACLCAASAQEALEVLEANDIDTLLADIHMPGNVSLELVETVARIRPGLPVVILTGQPSFETAARSVSLPVSAYLTKPPETRELAQALDRAIAGYRDLRVVRSGRDRLRAWDRDLAEFERLLQNPSVQPGTAPLEDYLRVSLRQIIAHLAELERALRTLDERAADRLRQVDHVAALRHTVEVLERTRQNFKSKELADLRRQLEWLLRDDPGPGTSAQP